jgi:hypothetical protein
MIIVHDDELSASKRMIPLILVPTTTTTIILKILSPLAFIRCRPRVRGRGLAGV